MTDAERESARLRVWASAVAELSAAVRERMDAEVYSLLREATSVFRLRDLGPAALHDWGGVHNEFHELVVIERDAGTVTLLVAADD